ncbi:MAG: hypothetical protein ACRDRK_26790, partial [Pseudonocardia sp.]
MLAISGPGGVYSALRVPVAELTVGDEPAVIVLFTHDCGPNGCGLAARVAWPLWCAAVVCRCGGGAGRRAAPRGTRSRSPKVG